MRTLFGGVTAAWRDVVGALEAHAGDRLGIFLPKLALGFLVAVCLYVPLHEALHAAGCIVLGGTVQVLEIAPLFGGVFLSRIFPVVSPATEYAGRLAKFDVGGSDMRLIGIDLAPYLLTILVGVPLLRRLSRKQNAWLLGAAFVMGIAPWMSLGGDYYEIGSVLVTDLLAAFGHDWSALRSDDMVAVWHGLWRDPGSLGAGRHAGFLVPALVVFSSFLLGVVLASATYQLGSLAAAACDLKRWRLGGKGD